MYSNFVEAVFSSCKKVSPTHRGVVFHDVKAGKTDLKIQSYTELLDQSTRLANTLYEEGYQGERCLMMCPPGLDYIMGFVAGLIANVIMVPVYPPKNYRNNWVRLKSIIDDSKPKLLFTTASEYQQYRQAFDEIESMGIRCLFLDELELTGSVNIPPLAISSDDLAYLQYTSGSTSAPKGLCVSHGNILHNMELTSQSLNLPERKVIVSWLPFYHDMGLIGTLFQALYFGAEYIFTSPFSFVKEPIAWLKLISDYQATISWAPNFAYDLCVNKVNEEDFKSLDLSSWKVAANMAEPVRVDTLNKFYETFSAVGFQAESLCPAYGMAETTLTISACPSGLQPKMIEISYEQFKKGEITSRTYKQEDRIVSLVGSGRVAGDQTVIIVDTNSGDALPENKVGEIWVSGDSVTHGYFNWGGHDASAFSGKCASYPERNFLKTGDLGFFQEKELFITGRKKDVIIIRGENYYPQDIEHVLQEAIPQVRKGCLAAFSIELHGEETLVVVAEVKKNTANVNYEELTTTARMAVLNEFGISLHELVFIEPGSYIRTSSGKVQRSLSREKYLSGDLQQIKINRDVILTKQVNENKLLQWLKEEVASLLKISKSALELDVALVNYGLNSMSATELASSIEKKLGRSIPLEVAFDYPTITALNNYLNRGPQTEFANFGNASKKNHSDQIAIVGMACRFPGGDGLDKFWDMLINGNDAFSTIGLERWNVESEEPSLHAITRGGFIDDIEKFDSRFFGITPREAEHVDPQQRILLELCHHALEDAGLTRELVASSQTGVYIGISDPDYARQQLKFSHEVSSYAGTGSALSIAANRISYYWDLKGPSFAIDSACSSSLTALNAACRDLQSGEIDTAIVGAANLLVSPDLSLVYQKSNMLAADSLCKVFDDAADGYVRGEGAGVIVLKRKQDAVSNKDPIHAVVCASAVMQDGASNGITAPVGPAQSQLVSRVLAKASLLPEEIDYVEAHGTGTALGDPIEVAALSKAFNCGKRANQLLIGSVKANIGHLESAAGIAGLIKTCLSLGHEYVPPQVHLKKPSNKIPWSKNGISVVPSNPLPWPKSEARMRRAGISSFGFGGTIAHVIVEEAPVRERDSAASAREQGVLCLSAKTPAALTGLVEKYQHWLASEPDVTVGDVCYTAAVGRSHFNHRLAVTGNSLAALKGALESVSVPETSYDSPSVAWLFSGQGAQYAGMGQGLYQDEAVFREAMDQCAQLLEQELDVPLTDLLWGASSERLSETRYTQPALFALEYSLAMLWQSWGHTPALLMGHSVGEYAAACVAGVFSLADGLRLIAARGRLMDELTSPGRMVVLFADASRVESLLDSLKAELVASPVAIAAYNGPQNVVVSGGSDGIARVLAEAAELGMNSHELSVSRAFHSPLMAPMLSAFREVAASVTYHAPGIRLVSNVTGREEVERFTEVDYWVSHIEAPVAFAKGMDALSASGVEVYVELGPDQTLVGMGRGCGIEAARWLPSLLSDDADTETLAGAVAGLYAVGHGLDWSRYYAGRDHLRVHVPTYAFDRKPYWFELSGKSIDHRLETRKSSNTLPIHHVVPDISIMDMDYEELEKFGLSDHCVFERPICAGAFQIAQAINLFHRTKNKEQDLSALICQGINFLGPLALDDKDIKVQYQLIDKGEYCEFNAYVFSVESNDWSKFFSVGKIFQSKIKTPEKLQQINFSAAKKVEESKIYQQIGQVGLSLSNQYKTIETVYLGSSELSAQLKSFSSLSPEEPQNIHLLIDSMLQCAVFEKLHYQNKESTQPLLYVPFAIDEVTLSLMELNKSSKEETHCVVRSSDIETSKNVYCLTKTNSLKVALTGVSLKPFPDNSTSSHQKLYSQSFSPIELPLKTSVRKQGVCLVFAPKTINENVLNVLENVFVKIVYVSFSEEFQKNENSLSINISNRNHWENLAKYLQQDDLPLLAALTLWTMDTTEEKDISKEFSQQVEQYANRLYHFGKGLTYLNSVSERHVPMLFCTKTAIVLSAEEKCVNPEQGMLSGFLQSLRHEAIWLDAYQLDFELIDKESLNLSTVSQVLQTLVKSVENKTPLTTDTFIYRQNTFYQPDIVSQKFQNDRPEYTKHDVFLVTGGLGELGFHSCKWLVARGAKKIILLQRSVVNLEQQDKVQFLQAEGVDVVTALCDLSRKSEVEECLFELEKIHGSIDGVIHTAGALADGLMTTLEWQEYYKPMRSKCEGTINLIDFFKGRELNFLILYSSISALLGPPGQSNYAMANGFLDAIVSYPGGERLNIKSINWGPWQDTKMTKTQGVVKRFEENYGVLTVDANYAERILDTVAVANHSQFIACRFKDVVYEATDALPVRFKRFLNIKAAISSESDALDTLTLDKSMLVENISRIVKQVMKLPESDQLSESRTLRELGMDSVMAVELQNKIGKFVELKLPATLFFDYPTIAEVSGYILKRIEKIDNVENKYAEPADVIEKYDVMSKEQDFDALNEMSVDDLSAMLASELSE